MLLQKLMSLVLIIKQKSWQKKPASSLKIDHLSRVITERKTTKKSAIELEIINFEDLPR